MLFVKIPPAFFKKAKQEYSDWRFAWFREIIQNSVDAGASEVRFSCDYPDARLRITASDNGCGMTLHTMETVLLALGCSAKADDDSVVGGFGMAKNIILLAHSSWEVRSGTNRVYGMGGTYEKGLCEHVNGTEVSVTFDEDDSGLDLMEKAFLRFCWNYGHTSVQLVWNNNSYTTKARVFEYEKDLDIGNLMFSEKSDSDVHSLWVRVNGIPMFEYRLWSRSSKAFQAILDLKDSRNVLTLNRDGLRGDHQRSLNELIHRLSDDLQGLKRGTLEFQITLNPDTSAFSGFSGSVDESLEPLQDATTDTLNKIHLKLRSNLIDARYPQNFEVRVHGIALRGTRDQQSGVTSVRSVRRILGQSMNKKLAIAWMTACKAILYLPRAAKLGVSYDSLEGPSLLGFDPYTPFTFKGKTLRFGFIFDSTTEALCSSTDTSVTLYVNPNVFGPLFPWRGRSSIGNLIDLAFHEVTHVFEPNHGAEFCISEMQLRREYRVSLEDKDVYQAAYKVFNSDSEVNDCEISD